MLATDPPSLDCILRGGVLEKPGPGSLGIHSRSPPRGSGCGKIRFRFVNPSSYSRNRSNTTTNFWAPTSANVAQTWGTTT